MRRKRTDCSRLVKLIPDYIDPKSIIISVSEKFFGRVQGCSASRTDVSAYAGQLKYYIITSCSKKLEVLTNRNINADKNMEKSNFYQKIAQNLIPAVKSVHKTQNLIHNIHA